MSTALAIAGVTAVLRDRLNDGLVNHNVAGLLGSSVTVSVRAPDRVVPPDGSEVSQLNLFLYQVSLNAAWSNQRLPAFDPGGRQRLSNPYLALDLYYLVSAYSGGDLHAEILLGYAMQLLHEFPVITRDMVHTALTPSPDVGIALPPALRALADCGLADQIEQLRITPQTLTTEESSRLWTATQSSYRPTVAYQVSVVLIEATRPAISALPVLTRGEIDPVYHREAGVAASPSLVPALPTLAAILPADGQPVAVLDTTITFKGHHLNGSEQQVHLSNARLDIDELIPAAGPNVADHLELLIPPARSADFPVGVYAASGQVKRPGDSLPRETNRLGLTLAPNITNLPQTKARDGSGNATVTLTFTPALRAGQRVALLLGDQEILPQSHTRPTGSLDFALLDMQPGTYLLRLRIDGIDSPLVNHTSTPPSFLDKRVTLT